MGSTDVGFVLRNFLFLIVPTLVTGIVVNKIVYDVIN